MLIMMMHKHDKTTEAGALPKSDLIAQMGDLIGGLAQQGVLRDGAGLGKSATRTRITFKGGERTLLDGPYKGSDNELIASFMQLTVKSRAEAVEWASKLGRIYGDAEIEVGKTTEEWDLGLVPEPPNAPLHYLVLQKATKDSEAGKPVSAKIRGEVDALKKEMKDAGVLNSAATLTPSAQGKRVHMGGGKRSVVDGPFTESKELIGGFALMELPSIEACLDIAWRYGDILLTSVETLEIDIRPVLEVG
jgi:hypothetical protein